MIDPLRLGRDVVVTATNTLVLSSTCFLRVSPAFLTGYEESQTVLSKVSGLFAAPHTCGVAMWRAGHRGYVAFVKPVIIGPAR
jgi:hypothetical protein